VRAACRRPRPRRFGAEVTIADLARHSFPDFNCNLVHIYEVWERLEEDWRFELDRDASTLEYATGVSALQGRLDPPHQRLGRLLRRLWLPPLPWLTPSFQELVRMRFQPTAETLAIVARLGGHWNGRYALVPCPAHEDRTPSLSIRQGQHSILVHCFAGCDGGDVMRAIRHVWGIRSAASGLCPCQPMIGPRLSAPMVRRGSDRGHWPPLSARDPGHHLDAARCAVPSSLPDGARPIAQTPASLAGRRLRAQRLIAIQRLFLTPLPASARIA
jgi:hypothetical protein